jgi:hypothetical protein
MRPRPYFLSFCEWLTISNMLDVGCVQKSVIIELDIAEFLTLTLLRSRTVL